jgi:hydroxypyruvate isomerase
LRERWSANLGFLWKELPLGERIARAAAAGFAAVEFHDLPQGEDIESIAAICRRNAVDVVGLNTRHGDTTGCAAISGRTDQARAEIVAALEAAAKLGASRVHVLAGDAADGTAARRSYIENLRYACDRAVPMGIDILIEPISPRAMPGYFLSSLELADALIDEVARPNLNLLFDCFHIHSMGRDLAFAFERRVDRIGHVQIAGIPARNEPDRGDVDYRELLPRFIDAGYAGRFGCEYRPSGESVEAGLGFMHELG